MMKSFVFYLYVFNPDIILKAAKSIRTKLFHLFSSKAVSGFGENKHQTILPCSKKKKTKQKTQKPPRLDRFFPTLGRADIQYLLFTGSITTTNEMEFCGRSPCPLQSPVPAAHLAPLPAWCRPSVGTGTPAWWWGHLLGIPLPHSTPAAALGGSGEGGEEAEVPPCAAPPSATEPHGSPGCSMHQAASVAASKALHWSLRAQPTCCLAADHGSYPGEVHSFSGPKSPS